MNRAEEGMSKVLALITRREGVVTSTDVQEWFIVNCDFPLNKMFGFSSELRGKTQGKGENTMECAR